MGQSRNENILENMLGAHNPLGEPQSREEALLMQILEQGGGGGSSTLAGLTDVSVTSPSNEQILKYDGETGKWVNDNIENEIELSKTAGPSSIVSFISETDMPLKSVLADIVATGGNGTPDNPNPINGYSSANITRCGVNLWELSDDTKNDSQACTYNYENNGVKVTASASYARVSYVYKVKVGQPYTISFYGSGTANFLNVYYGNSTSWGDSYGRSVLNSTRTKYTKTITPTTDTLFVGFYATNTGTTGDMVIEDFMLEIGSTASDTFTPYNGDTVTIAFGQTVYGGVLDVTRGKMHVTKGYGLLDGTVNPFASNFGVGGYVGYTPSSLGIDNMKADTLFVSNCYQNTGPNKISVYGGNILINDSRFGSTINSLADWNDWLTNTSNVQFIYELATPFDIDLTPEVISAIVGTNNVFADCGQTEVKYLAEG